MSKVIGIVGIPATIVPRICCRRIVTQTKAQHIKVVMRWRGGGGLENSNYTPVTLLRG